MIDYRDLLKRYMAMVGDEEGTTFVSCLSYHGEFTAKEKRELEEINEETRQ